MGLFHSFKKVTKPLYESQPKVCLFVYLPQYFTININPIRPVGGGIGDGGDRFGKCPR